MNMKAQPASIADGQHRIFMLVVATEHHFRTIDHIVSHTRWRTTVVHSVHGALEALKNLDFSIVLCEQYLTDGTWHDVMNEIKTRGLSAQLIVLSSMADDALWQDVLNSGGYDLLSMPPDPREIYRLVPLAWRQSVQQREASAKYSVPLGHAAVC